MKRLENQRELTMDRSNEISMGDIPSNSHRFRSKSLCYYRLCIRSPRPPGLDESSRGPKIEREREENVVAHAYILVISPSLSFSRESIVCLDSAMLSACWPIRKILNVISPGSFQDYSQKSVGVLLLCPDWEKKNAMWHANAFSSKRASYNFPTHLGRRHPIRPEDIHTKL